MSEPTVETFRVLAANQGIVALSDERLAQAAEAHASFRPDLEALRAVPFTFLADVVEPDSALRWLEQAPHGMPRRASDVEVPS